MNMTSPTLEFDSNMYVTLSLNKPHDMDFYFKPLIDELLGCGKMEFK